MLKAATTYEAKSQQTTTKERQDVKKILREFILVIGGCRVLVRIKMEVQ